MRGVIDGHTDGHTDRDRLWPSSGIVADLPPAEPFTRRHARSRQRALKIDDDLLEELRRQMGITREQAVRLARLVLLPPPDVVEGHVTTTLPTGECP